MKIPVKANYALRILMDIGINADKEITRADYIATRQNISEKYVEFLIEILKQAKVVEEDSEKQFKLAKDAEKIKVADILDIMEDDFKFIDIMNKEKYQVDFDRIIKFQLWDEIARAVKNSVETKSLKSLMDNYNEVYAGHFYI